MVNKFNKFTVSWGKKTADIRENLTVWDGNDIFFIILGVTDQDLRMCNGRLPPVSRATKKLKLNRVKKIVSNFPFS